MKDFYSDDSFFSRFVSVEDATILIDQLEQLNLSEIDDTYLERFIEDKIKIVPYTNGVIKAGAELFRARLNINEEPFTEVKDIWVPPIDLIKDYGRANRPKEQIFYCASNFRLASFEVIQDFKNSFSPKHEVAFLTIGVWKVIDDINLADIIHSPVLHNVRDDIRANFKKHQEILYQKHLTPEIATASSLISQFFSDQFTKREIKSPHDYKISAYYTRLLKTMNSKIAPQFTKEKFDGVNYPSVAMKYKGDNQAIFFESAKQKLKLINAIQVVCSNLDFETGDFTAGIMHEAKSIVDGKIVWKSEIYRP